MSDVPDTGPEVGGDGPLSGIRVIALEQAVAGPLCSRQLADLGAEVIKVERSGSGDFARAYDGVVHGESAHFVWLNHGKRSIGLDLSAASDRPVFEALLAGADVFVHNLGPGAVDRLGFDPVTLAERHPRLVDCEISGYGAGGPYQAEKAFDLLVQGESGLLSITGTTDAPARVGISIADIAAGSQALAAILAALIERTTTGRGRHLEIAMLDCLADWLAVPALQTRYGGAPPRRTGLHHPTIAPYGAYPASDGPPVLLAVQTAAQWQRLCLRVLERPDLLADERFATNELRVAHRAALDELLAAALGGLDRESLVARLDAADIPHANVSSMSELLTHPQLAARGGWLEVDTPTGPATVPRPVLGRAAGAGGDRRGRARVPALDEDGPVIRAALAGEGEA